MTERLNQATESEENDPFKITTDNALSLYLMKEALLVPEEENPNARDRVIYVNRMNILPGVSRTVHNDQASLARLWERVWMGVSGGLARIVPMLLMVLHKDEVTTLSTASVATMLFAFGLAFLGKGLKGQEVLAAVAAYAAVLVVFVGASS
jgi:VIT1/CCC1 family predicted Fe2+/Mn2+ transporter